MTVNLSDNRTRDAYPAEPQSCTPPSTIRLHDLGTIFYHDAWRLQKQAMVSVMAGGAHTLLLCEHPPIFTMGRLAHMENVLCPLDELKSAGVLLEHVDRGGDITFHGPGQLVAYPILRLSDIRKDVKWYMNTLEWIIIEALRHCGIDDAHPEPGQRGVWVGNKKIASIGIGIRRWVSYHGFAINVDTNMRYFKMIKPCGCDVEMTSMAEVTGKPIAFYIVKDAVTRCFARAFQLAVVKKER